MDPGKKGLPAQDSWPIGNGGESCPNNLHILKSRWTSFANIVNGKLEEYKIKGNWYKYLNLSNHKTWNFSSMLGTTEKKWVGNRALCQTH